jgi:hypothetical protein
MESRDEGRRSTTRLWIATAAVILVLVAVWKFIDYRMQPPPPPHKIVAPTAAP